MNQNSHTSWIENLGLVKGIHASHFGHHIHAHSQSIGMLTAKVEGVAAPEIF